MFRLAGDDWSPPEHLRLSNMAGSDRFTWEADFSGKDAAIYRLRVRMQLSGGKGRVLEESLTVRFHFEGKAKP